MRAMNVLDLFSGLGGWAAPFRDAGDTVVTLDMDPRFGCTFTRDILTVSSLDELLPVGATGWDVVLASPPCEAFSVLRIGTNWTGPDAAPPHQPRTDQARLSVRIVEHTRRLIEASGVPWFIIENPVAKLRKLPAVAGLERRTVTYCQLGELTRKPTDLWGVFPPTLTLPPPCAVTRRTVERNGRVWAADAAGEPCHVSAPRGSTTGIQGPATAAERAVIPYALANMVRDAVVRSRYATPSPTMLF